MSVNLETACSATLEPFIPLTQDEIETLTPDEMLVRAELLFSELPIEIQNPVDRGAEVPAAWATTEIDSLPVADLVSLSDDDFKKYEEVFTLTQKANVPMLDLHKRAFYRHYSGKYSRHEIPEQWRPPRRTAAFAQKLSNLALRLFVNKG